MLTPITSGSISLSEKWCSLPFSMVAAHLKTTHTRCGFKNWDLVISEVKASILQNEPVTELLFYFILF
jgi:hypothetical protein